MATDDGMVPDDDEQHEGIMCNRCGEEGLHWGYFRGRSRLFDDDGALHNCPQSHERTE